MTDPDPIRARIEAFDRENGGGATVCKNCGGHTLTLTATEALIARLKPEGSGDAMRVLYRSWQNRWKVVGDMGGLVLPLDEALDANTDTDIFWTWTRGKIVQTRADIVTGIEWPLLAKIELARCGELTPSALETPVADTHITLAGGLNEGSGR